MSKSFFLLLCGFLVFLIGCGRQNGNNPNNNPGQPTEPNGMTSNFSQYSGTLTYQNTDEAFYYDRQYYAYDLDLKTAAATPLYAAYSLSGTVFKAKTGEVIYQNDVPDMIIRKPGSAESLFIEKRNFTEYPIEGVMSDDGQLIAFTRYYGSILIPPTQLQVEVVDRNKELVAVFDNYYTPAWTPDGRLVMVGLRGLYITDQNLDNLRQLGPSVSGPQMPSVSPDGRKVAYVVDGQIFTMNINGTNLKQITDSGNRVMWPSWSPDGKFIVVTLNAGLYENAMAIIPSDPAEPTYIDDDLLLQVKEGRKTYFLEAMDRVTWR